jgi:hypothetical protein
MEKYAQRGEGGLARPPPFTISTITYKVVVYVPVERADTLPLFLLYPYYMDSVVLTFDAQYDIQCLLKELHIGYYKLEDRSVCSAGIL